jgi:hypothetical protein
MTPMLTTAPKNTYLRLYEIAEHECLMLDRKEFSHFVQQVEDFFADLSRVSKTVASIKDYKWICETIVLWQLFFASTLNEPKVIQIPNPPAELEQDSSPGEELTVEELTSRRQDTAKVFALERSRHFGTATSTTQEMVQDWHNAETMLVSNILDGSLNFVTRISPETYPLLEQIWLDDVKQLRAYIYWQNGVKVFDPEDSMQDYFIQCQHLRRMLIDPVIKASPSKLGKPLSYITEKYLVNGLLHRDISMHQRLNSSQSLGGVQEV